MDHILSSVSKRLKGATTSSVESLYSPSHLDLGMLASHSGRILMLGYGSVGQAILPLVLRHIKVDLAKITVLEMGENADLFKERHRDTPIVYIEEEIVEQNMAEILSSLLVAGDFLINVSLNIDGIAIVKWCLDHDVLYIDTSIERWGKEPDETIPEKAERTLYHTHHKMHEMAKAYHNKGAATCVVANGANPGLISHFTKAALLDVANAMELEFVNPKTRKDWARLMQATGTKVIHIAERDTQVIDKPKVKGEFVNTWSCEGFWAEGRAPAELGWGTHETPEPYNGFIHLEGPKNAAYLNQPGVSTLIKSWVPKGGSFNGFLVQHSESITISKYFTVIEDNKAVYRPTVNYAYQPCDAAIVSVHEFRGRELEIQDTKRIVKDEITSGIDELGVLLLGHGKNAWWYGSQLGIGEARSLIPGENATSVQVAASLLATIVWVLRHPNLGYVEPDYIPFRDILKIAIPYLGPMVSVQTDWTPLEDRNILFKRPLDTENAWRFENFRVWS
jgi:homospermidine synthase